MTNRIILAVEPETKLAFDRAYAHNMRLPFHTGWDHYEVFERRGRDLIHVASPATFSEAAQIAA